MQLLFNLLLLSCIYEGTQSLASCANPAAVLKYEWCEGEEVWKVRAADSRATDKVDVAYWGNIPTFNFQPLILIWKKISSTFPY